MLRTVPRPRVYVCAVVYQLNHSYFTQYYSCIVAYAKQCSAFWSNVRAWNDTHLVLVIIV